MRKAVLLIAAPVFFLTAVCFAALNPVAEKDQRQDSWDFGTVKQGELLKHEFILKNTTGQAYEISSIHTSCGCTASEAEKKSLFPGESTPVKVTFNSHGYLGEVTQFVYVNTTSEDTGIIKFTIKAKVVKKK